MNAFVLHGLELDESDAADLVTVTIGVALGEIDCPAGPDSLARIATGWTLLHEALRDAQVLGATVAQMVAWTELPAYEIVALLS
jgi:hypothetical protein